MSKKLSAFVCSLLFILAPNLAFAEWQQTTNSMYSDRQTVTTSRIVLTTVNPPPTGGRVLPTNLKGSLTIKHVSGDALTISTDNAVASVTAGMGRDKWVIDATYPVLELGVFSTGRLVAVSAGSTTFDYLILVSK